MTEEEKQEEVAQPQETNQDPNIVYRPIEVEVNLLRRKIDRLIFLALIVAIAGCGVLGMKWSKSKNAANEIALKSQKYEKDVQTQLYPRLQQQGQLLGAIIMKLDELRKDDPKVAEMWNQMKLGNLIQPQQGAAPADTATTGGGE